LRRLPIVKFAILALLAAAELQTGDRVTVECQGDTVPAEVVISAAQGKSLLLRLDSAVCGRSGIVVVFDRGYGFVFQNGGRVGVTYREPSPKS
jgi:hypothetical protein